LLDAVAGRTLAIEGTSLAAYDGGWAELVRKREERGAPTQQEPRPSKPKAQKAGPQRAQPSELQRLEAEIERRETAVAELELELAADWSNADTLAAHRRARDELQALIAEWEVLFERAQTPT
jgi:ATPase subunit of ABC transporter with duplicated ATPase domains